MEQPGHFLRGLSKPIAATTPPPIKPETTAEIICVSIYPLWPIWTTVCHPPPSGQEILPAG